MQWQEFRESLLTETDMEAAARLTDLAGGPVDALVVLGSGLAASLTGATESGSGWGTPFTQTRISDIPGLSAPTADGHADSLDFYGATGRGGTPLTVLVARGRTHLYEGGGADSVTALSRAAAGAGVGAAVLCNANGCLRDWDLGDVMTIVDHANLSGSSPFTGTVFLDPTHCWDPQMTAALESVTGRRGTYVQVRGPEYQTRLEARMVADAGGDVIGMSTVLEALMLKALGVRVAGMSVVSDLSFAQGTTDPVAVLTAAANAQQTVRAGIEAALLEVP